MAAPSVHGVIRRKPSGDRRNRTEGNRPPPPLSRKDLISALPDAVIHHIFSFLPIRDVVKTSILSKRWRSTWATTAHLVFEGDQPHNSMRFPSVVDTVLSQCSSPRVKKFHVTGFKYVEADRPKLDFWLRFVAERRVEDLRLRVTEWMYTLPPLLHCSSWLVRLEVSRCRFSSDVTIRWPCLKVLSIQNAVLKSDILEGIFRGSPVLESVELRHCTGVSNLIIDSTSVKELVLIDAERASMEKIWAPHLLSLRVSGTWRHYMFRLDDISSLVEAELLFSIRLFAASEKRGCYDLLKELIEKLHGVPTITMGGWCLKLLSLFEMEGVPSPMSKCQNLTLHALVNQWDLQGIAYVLRSSECLKKLIIQLTGLRELKYWLDEESKDRFNYDEEDFLCSRKGNFQCLTKHLKRVKIIGFKADSFGSKHLLSLMKFLLGDTLMLEKMIIKAELHARNGQKHLQAAVLSKLFGVSQCVLSYRRASKTAEVIFSYSFK